FHVTVVQTCALPILGTIGNPVLLKTDNFAIKNVALIKQKKELLNTFLIQYLNTDLFEKQVRILNAGNTQKFLALGQIRSLNILKDRKSTRLNSSHVK